MPTATLWPTPSDRAVECVKALFACGGVPVEATAAGNAFQATCGCGFHMAALTPERVLEAMTAHSDYKGQQ